MPILRGGPVSSFIGPDYIELHTTETTVTAGAEVMDEALESSGVDSVPFNPNKDSRRRLLRLGLSFFLFGLINNVLYVIILSAALDLVPPSTPKGIIAFCNIAPALVAKVGWPYILKGRIRYTRRLAGCCLLSTFGMIVVAASDSLIMRLLGIGLASFSSGLGELTFLQLSTTYQPSTIGGHSVGYFASGTGAAGIVGALAWWELRNLGVRTGVGMSSVLPFVTPLTYLFILPHPEEFSSRSLASAYGYTPLAAADDIPATGDDEGDATVELLTESILDKSHVVTLSAKDKWRLVKPLLLKYMLPLFCVYTFEYTINQGIAPTLVYPIPPPEDHPIMRLVIHSIRDYYPLWQMVYQSTVFLSRSSISFGLPPLPAHLLSLPAIIQFAILVALSSESGLGIVPDDSEGLAAGLIFLLISLEGVCGGLAYDLSVNVFYRVNQERHHYPHAEGGDPDPLRAERVKQEREFQIGSIGFADSSGILLASLLAMPTEIGLCRAQVARGKLLCTEL
ncbi:hypothetical protein M0805_007210 [Coniferiporia weirii]|nr:hypothetical protein M0805_007210 [Coniferiporia weirii]